MSSIGNVQVASGLVSVTSDVATSQFFKNNGNYIGGVSSLLMIVITIFLALTINKNNRIFYMTGIVANILLIVIANAYYFYAKNKTTKPDDLTSINSIYANVSLIPIYLLIFGLGIMILFHIK